MLFTSARSSITQCVARLGRTAGRFSTEDRQQRRAFWKWTPCAKDFRKFNPTWGHEMIQLRILCSICLAAAVFSRAPTFAQQPVATEEANIGVVDSLGIEARPDRMFRFSKAEGGIGEAVAKEGILFAARSDNSMQAIEIKDAKVLWTQRFAETISGMAIQAEERLFVTSYAGVSSINQKTGELLWHTAIQHGLAAPVVIDNQIFAAGYDGHAYCLDGHDGAVVWAHDYLKDAPDDPPGFDGDRARFGDIRARPRPASTDGDLFVFAVFDQCRLIAIDCKTGERRWDFKTKGWMLGRPTITDKYVFAGSQDKNFYCVDKRDGRQVWEFATGSRIEASASAKGNRVVFGSCDANLYCLHQDSGEVFWSYATEKRKKNGGPIYEQPLLAGETVYLPTMEGTVYAINLVTGNKVWSLRPSRNSEIDGSFSDGKNLFVTTRLNSEKEGEDALYLIGK
jgi:eukaryotic-like serine/threonine-protein kinase